MPLVPMTPLKLKPLCLLGLAFGFLQAFGVQGHATTMTFDSFENAGSDYIYTDGAVIEAGFSVSTGLFFSPNHLNSWYAGSAGLGSNNDGDVITLTKVGGGTFNFDSIDLSTIGIRAASPITFTGTVFGGGAVTASFSIPGPIGYKTYELPDSFQNLTSVTWIQEFPYHTFDNITVDATSVPDGGSTIALLGAVMTGLGCVRRRY